MTTHVLADAELAVKSYLEPLLAPIPVRVTLPQDWTPADGAVLVVSSDGAFRHVPKVVAWHTIRLVAWSGSRAEAHATAAGALAHLDAHPGGHPITQTRALTGPLVTRDPDHEADLASVTCRVGIRTNPTA